MPDTSDTLLEKILAFPIDHPDSSFSFSDRLSRENGWSKAFTQRTILEYKKFIYLIVISDHPMTPSDEVDQVWHLHLTYSRSYWQDLCRDLLGTTIHHDPTQGGQQEGEKYWQQYQSTLEKYQAVFGGEPPDDIWPQPKQRFEDADQFIRSNQSQYWLIKKPSTLLVYAFILPLFLVACVQDDSDSDFLFFIKIAIGVFVVYKVVKWLGGFGGGRGGGRGSGGGMGSGCGGCSTSGCGGGGCGSG